MTLVISHSYISKFYSYAIDCARRVACRRGGRNHGGCDDDREGFASPVTRILRDHAQALRDHARASGIIAAATAATARHATGTHGCWGQLVHRHQAAVPVG